MQVAGDKEDERGFAVQGYAKQISSKAQVQLSLFPEVNKVRVEEMCSQYMCNC